MGAKYFTLLTRIGEAKLAEAVSTGKPLGITQMGVGDGGGVLQTPDPMQTKLVNERRRAPINSLSVDPNNASQIIAEQIIPENEGGFWLREIGLYDASGNLIAVANCPETYKPELKEGSGRVQTVRMILIVSRTDALTLTFDPTVALATRRYADTLLADHIVAANPHKQYAPLLSPAFSGNPTAPTPPLFDADSSIATTGFVQRALGNLRGVYQVKDSTVLTK
ncbi:Phage tail fiber protein [Dickeya aquatica]|uniref:Phage tail fiber protein n=1 Tax=Dickeya aquatica TaxID=1401087 RepID=A0A375A5G5_9GAMM|nr:Phage tail fiber protein [Dickeya aquatica]